MNEIEKINAVFFNLNYGYFWKAKIILTLNNSNKIEIQTSIYKLEIRKKELKSIGAKSGEVF